MSFLEYTYYYQKISNVSRLEEKINGYVKYTPMDQSRSQHNLLLL